MTSAELAQRGFKRKNWHGDYWFELKVGKHKFMTNDNLYNGNKDAWHVGYFFGNHEETWFDNNIESTFRFDLLFLAIVGKSAEQAMADRAKKRTIKATILKETKSKK